MRKQGKYIRFALQLRVIVYLHYLVRVGDSVPNPTNKNHYLGNRS
jgi:hypothetical protein